MSIASDNDMFRTTMIRTPRLKIVLTQGVSTSPYREAIITAVRQFDNFNKDNDPHGEHDFGRFIVAGQSYMFKIDYYDDSFEYGADPKEGSVNRVLTIMRADEY